MGKKLAFKYNVEENEIEMKEQKPDVHHAPTSALPIIFFTLNMENKFWLKISGIQLDIVVCVQFPYHIDHSCNLKTVLHMFQNDRVMVLEQHWEETYNCDSRKTSFIFFEEVKCLSVKQCSFAEWIRACMFCIIGVISRIKPIFTMCLNLRNLILTPLPHKLFIWMITNCSSKFDKIFAPP